MVVVATRFKVVKDVISTSNKEDDSEEKASALCVVMSASLCFAFTVGK